MQYLIFPHWHKWSGNISETAPYKQTVAYSRVYCRIVWLDCITFRCVDLINWQLSVYCNTTSHRASYCTYVWWLYQQRFSWHLMVFIIYVASMPPTIKMDSSCYFSYVLLLTLLQTLILYTFVLCHIGVNIERQKSIIHVNMLDCILVFLSLVF